MWNLPVGCLPTRPNPSKGLQQRPEACRSPYHSRDRDHRHFPSERHLGPWPVSALPAFAVGPTRSPPPGLRPGPTRPVDRPSPHSSRVPSQWLRALVGTGEGRRQARRPGPAARRLAAIRVRAPPHWQRAPLWPAVPSVPVRPRRRRCRSRCVGVAAGAATPLDAGGADSDLSSRTRRLTRRRSSQQAVKHGRPSGGFSHRPFIGTDPRARSFATRPAGPGPRDPSSSG
jgi:hypothetical protein